MKIKTREPRPHLVIKNGLWSDFVFSQSFETKYQKLFLVETIEGYYT